MNHTDRVRDYLTRGPACCKQIAEGLGLREAQVTYAIQGMQVRGNEISTVARMPGSRQAIYALMESLPKVTQKTLVATALSNEPDLARVWR